MYDVAIIGLGPAGATLARRLSPDLSILALDRDSRGEDGFSKPCGGLLAPDAQKALARQRLALPLDVLVSPQIFSVQTTDLLSGQTRHYPRSYVNMDRHKFDLWLRSFIPARVDVRSGARCTDVRRCRGGYEVTWREDGEPRTARARFLVGADGAASIVRRRFYPGMQLRRYTAIQQWFHTAQSAPVYACFFDPRHTDCYAWGINKDDYYILGGAFAPKGALEQYGTLKQRVLATGPALGEPVKTEACQIIRPAPASAFALGENGVFLIGEAAGLVSPSSLEGISYALESACALGRALSDPEQPNPNEAYRRATAGLRLKLHAKQLKCPFMYQPLLRRAVMASRVGSIGVSSSVAEKIPE